MVRFIDAVEDKAGGIFVHDYRNFIHLFGQFIAYLDHDSSEVLAPLVISTSFHQNGRVEKMIADDSVRSAGSLGYFGNADV
ncbi:MAG: hypothetical protein MZV70_46195 [Desulfobacterales bacterium]|nr:hypothetical protein [Desulfobacterales bacterium]